jgi:hypothetical protein
MLHLKDSITKSDKVSVTVNLNEKYAGVGRLVIEKMKL